MIVNVASRCGYTSQYRGLQELYKNHQEELEIIAIPCNDFGSQESGSNSDIKNFCETRYGVSFTMARNKILNLPLSVRFTNGFQTQSRMGGIATYPPGIFVNI